MESESLHGRQQIATWKQNAHYDESLPENRNYFARVLIDHSGRGNSGWLQRRSL